MAGGRHDYGISGFGCRILVVFKGAGFEFSFLELSNRPVTLSPQNRPSTIQLYWL